MRVLVLTISDRAFNKIYEDRSGRAIEKILCEKIEGVQIERRVVPDEKPQILKAFEDCKTMDAILTTGGTGLGPRDVTPEVTTAYCERMVPGISEALRAASLTQTSNAMLSRGAAGLKGNTLIINLPGSVRAAEFYATMLAPVLVHAVSMMHGTGHE